MAHVPRVNNEDSKERFRFRGDGEVSVKGDEKEHVGEWSK